MSVIWQDDFSSGNALAVSYTAINNAETNASCGQSGGWGCRTTGTASQQHYGRFEYRPATPLATNYIKASFDADRSAFLAGEVGAWCLAISDESGDVPVELTHGDDADNTQLVVNSYWLGAELTSATGAITPGSWQTVVLEAWFSTHTLNGGFYDANADGRIRVSVDGTAVIDQSSIQVGGSYAVVNGTNQVYGVIFGPSGNGDNVLIEDATSAWVDVANFVEQEIPSSAFPSGAARVLGYLWSSDATAVLQARLYNVTDASSAGESAEMSGDTPQACDFAVTLASGTKAYRLQVTSDVTDTDIFMSSRGVGP